mgnify:CR=1 FL=1
MEIIKEYEQKLKDSQHLASGITNSNQQVQRLESELRKRDS